MYTGDTRNSDFLFDYEVHKLERHFGDLQSKGGNFEELRFRFRVSDAAVLVTHIFLSQLTRSVG
jgi:hypothetical protein